MNTNMTGFRWFSEIFALCVLDESCLSIRRVKYKLNLGGAKMSTQIFVKVLLCYLDISIYTDLVYASLINGLNYHLSVCRLRKHLILTQLI